MEPLTHVLRALADPTRCSILELLQANSRSVNDLTQHFSMSRPAVSKHLAILREARLVTSRREGRQQIYELDATPLSLAREWLDRFKAADCEPQPPARQASRPPVSRRVSRSDWRCW